MPLIYYRSHPQCEVSLWRADEPKEFFVAALKEHEFPTADGDRIKHAEKALQWYASRYLLTLKYPAGITTYRERKPHLMNGPGISFTHSGNVVGIMIGHQAAGLDIQEANPKLDIISRKFTTPEEIDRIGLTNRILALSLIWCIKEAVFKWYGTGVPFLSIRVISYDPVKDTAKVSLPREEINKEHTLVADFIDDLALAYVIE